MRRQVLIVDDSPEDRESISLALRQDTQVRYAVHAVGDGRTGLSRLQEGPDEYDLVILDYRLPDMNAAQFVEKLLGPDETPRVPIIVLTGSLEGRLEEVDALQHGVQDFFTKQEVTPEIIKRIARNAIERQRLVRQLIASERAAETARIEAERANRAKTQFLTLVSHELRTPLTAVLGFTELLRNNPDADDAAEMLSMVASSGEHLAELLNDLIDIAKVESGTLDVEPSPFNPRELIESACQLMAVRATDRGLPLELEVAPNLPEFLLSDSIRLRQILFNLLGNAIKFTDDGTVRCIVEWAPPTHEMTIQVQDTGPGIPAEISETLFSPFVQGESRSEKSREGIGLGLAISRHLARMMGGDLCVKNTGPRGTTFQLSIQASPYIPDAHDGEPLVAAAGSATPDFSGKRALIVEDTPANRYLLSRLLQPTGIEIEVASDGKEALDRITLSGSPAFDVVLMDMMMPVMDGFEATRRLKAHGVTTPVVALTAAAFADDQQRCRDAGCVEVLTKPIDIEALSRRLSDILLR